VAVILTYPALSPAALSLPQVPMAEPALGLVAAIGDVLGAAAAAGPGPLDDARDNCCGCLLNLGTDPAALPLLAATEGLLPALAQVRERDWREGERQMGERERE